MFVKKDLSNLHSIAFTQGQPTTIFGKYLFGRQFEI